MKTRIRKHESSENLIKRFCRKVKKSKIIEEYIENQYYKKPSEIRREKYFRRLALFEKLKHKEKQKRDD
jgi:ribosomal protein S21